MALPATDGAKLYAADVNKLGPFGSYTSKSDNTVYQAATDGFVLGIDGSSAVIRSDSSNPPTTIRIQGGSLSSVCPVKRGDYYKTNNFNTVYWLPIGS
jgi:hypothetical protein